MPTMQVEEIRALLAKGKLSHARCEVALAESRAHLAEARMHMERERRLELEEELRLERARRRRGLFGWR